MTMLPHEWLPEAERLSPLAQLTFNRGMLAAADHFEGWLADCARNGIDPNAVLESEAV